MTSFPRSRWYGANERLGKGGIRGISRLSERIPGASFGERSVCKGMFATAMCPIDFVKWR